FGQGSGLGRRGWRAGGERAPLPWVLLGDAAVGGVMGRRCVLAGRAQLARRAVISASDPDRVQWWGGVRSPLGHQLDPVGGLRSRRRPVSVLGPVGPGSGAACE